MNAAQPESSAAQSTEAAAEPGANAAAPGAPPLFTERLSGPFAPEVLWFAPPLFGAALLAYFADWPWAAALFALPAFFCVAFFRNPERAPEATAAADEARVLAPADGRVLCVEESSFANGAPALRVGIFLSVFDVHVNRAPAAGRVVEITRGGAGFAAAFNPEAAGNVQLRMTLAAEFGRVEVVQITGLIARRIVCHPRPGEWLKRGARYGLIRFGSRTDVLLPPDAAPQVRKGQTVRGGKTVLAVLARAEKEAQS